MTTETENMVRCIFVRPPEQTEDGTWWERYELVELPQHIAKSYIERNACSIQGEEIMVIRNCGVSLDPLTDEISTSPRKVDYLDEWHCEAPAIGSRFRVTRCEWDDEYAVRRIYEWEPGL